MADNLTEDDSRRIGKVNIRLVDNSEVGDESKSNTGYWGLKHHDLNTMTGVKLDILNSAVGNKL